MFEDFYGLSEEPFALNPDPRFFFLTQAHSDVLKLMVYGIAERRGFILLTGEKGTGKTAFIQHLLQTLDPNTKAISFQQPPKSFTQLLEVLQQSLKLPLGERNKGAMLRQFNDYLSRGAGQHENLAIIADNAQDLSKEFLEELRLLWNPHPGRLQEVFVGRPEIENKLNSWELRQLKQRISIRCRLKPLTEDESLRYIEHRLNKVGGRIAEIFTPEALSLICRYAGGIPGNINTLCTQALWAGYNFSKKTVLPSFVEEILEDSGILIPEPPAAPPLVKKARFRPPAHRVKRASFAAKLLPNQENTYETFYGLKKTPFDSQPDPRFFFTTKNCTQVWDSLLYGIERRKGFILLTGESGVGKTTLIALISLYLSTRGQKVIPIFNSPDNMEEIWQTLLRNLGLPEKEESKSTTLSRIDKDLIRRSSQGETITVIFDESQNLKREILEEIRLLSNSNPSTPKFLQLIFVGDSQFEKNLRGRKFLILNQRFEVRSSLLPLTPEESREYIEHRLQRAGSTASKVFTPRAVNLIVVHSSGIPRILNQVCHEALSVGYSQMKEKVDCENVREALVNLGLDNQGKWQIPEKAFSWMKKTLVRS
jgi:general secretion pathway protein A